MSSVSATTAPIATQAGTPAATTGASAPPAQGTVVATGTVQAQQGATQVQVQAQEQFQAQLLRLPDEPSTGDVLTGLTAAMAKPGINQTTSKELYDFHQLLFETQKAMTQAMLDLMAAT
jgi:hypothetical protein